MFGFLDKSIGFINRFIAAFGISAGVAIAFTNVVARYAFDASFTWAAELTIFMFLWSTFFGAAYCFKKDAHIAVTVVLEKVAPQTAKALMLLSHTVTFVFLGAVSYFGYEYLLLVIDLEETSIDLGIPMWIPYLVIPVAFAFAAFRVGEKIYEIIVTPAEEILQESEAEMILSEMGKLDECEKERSNKEILEEVHKKTGGML
jgi:C4-dicarboxylate transporter DctQ subunit